MPAQSRASVNPSVPACPFEAVAGAARSGRTAGHARRPVARKSDQRVVQFEGDVYPCYLESGIGIVRVLFWVPGDDEKEQDRFLRTLTCSGPIGRIRRRISTARPFVRPVVAV